jgi:hypothetical protein
MRTSTKRKSVAFREEHRNNNRKEKEAQETQECGRKVSRNKLWAPDNEADGDEDLAKIYNKGNEI